ncbi:hypothetical protein V6N12_013814, partial [Hibiscus sabdariffa]
DVIVFCILSVHPYLQIPEYDVGIIFFELKEIGPFL